MPTCTSGGWVLRGGQIGFIVSAYYLTNFLFQPFWGYISDLFQAKKLVLMGLAVLSAGTVLIYLRGDSFTHILITAAILGSTFPAIMPILDATAMEYIHRARVNYGSIRIFGSLGFMTAGLLGGQITGIFGLKSVFVGCSLTLLAIVIISSMLSGRAASDESEEDTQKVSAAPLAAIGRTDQIRKLIQNRSFAFFLMTTFVVQGCMAMGFGFLNIHISNLGAPDSFIGTVWALAALSEVPAFLAMAFFQKKIGARGIVLMAYSVMAVRWLLFSFVRDPLMIIPIQMMQGFSGGYFFGGSVTFVQEESPNGLKATGQTIFGAVNLGLGPIVGMSLGGQLADLIGLSNLFLVCALLTAGAAVFFVITQRGFAKPKET